MVIRRIANNTTINKQTLLITNNVRIYHVTEEMLWKMGFALKRLVKCSTCTKKHCCYVAENWKSADDLLNGYLVLCFSACTRIIFLEEPNIRYKTYESRKNFSFFFVSSLQQKFYEKNSNLFYALL